MALGCDVHMRVIYLRGDASKGVVLLEYLLKVRILNILVDSVVIMCLTLDVFLSQFEQTVA